MTVRPRLAMALIVAAAALLRLPALAQGPVLRVAVASSVASFDPDDTRQDAAAASLTAVYEGLLGYAPGTANIVGRLASAWRVSPDGLTYSFTLRRGVRFHDGQTMTAADVRASFARRRMAGLTLAYTLRNVAGTEAPAPDAFVVRLARPQPSFLDSLAGVWGPKVVAAAVWREHDAGDQGRAWLATHADGTGPFTLARLDRDRGLSLRRFDGYWGAAPHFAAVDVAVQPELGLQLLQLNAGSLDAVLDGYPSLALDELPAGLTADVLPAMTMLVGFVNPHGRLADSVVRRSAEAALNAKFWRARAFGDHAVVSGTLFPASMFETWDPVELPDDLDVAAQAVRRLSDTALVVGYPQAQQAAVRGPVEHMLALLHAIGFDASALALPPTFARADPATSISADPGLAPDIVIERISPDSAHPQGLASAFLTSDAPLNRFGFANAEADAGLLAAAGIAQRPAANRAYEKAAGVLIAAGGFVPLLEPQAVVVHRATLTGIANRPSDPPGCIDFSLASEAP